MTGTITIQYFKDEQLNQLACIGNVAQFVSFDPLKRQRFSCVRGFEPNHKFGSVSQALAALLQQSPERRINVRSFLPDDPQGHEFIYGISSLGLAEQEINRLSSSGFFVIANETVDVNDGGVSGVAQGEVIEFAPGATPRVVETGRIVSLPRQIAENLLQKVYGFKPSLPNELRWRTEFSIHPAPRGYKSDQTILWERQESPLAAVVAIPRWPNAFSESLGDKVFGLLIADTIGENVPRSLVISRALAPFTVGTPTGSSTKWIRTAPRTPEPGRFPTLRGWTDPFELMRSTDDAERIASVIVQDEVNSRFSGAVLTGSDGQPIIEGVAGFGDEFMLGHAGPERLNLEIVRGLAELHASLSSRFGSVRAEWTFDGKRIWIMQLQQESAISTGQTIVPGNVESEVDFHTSQGLSGLREVVALVQGRSVGIRVVGNVGVTSHIADVLRRLRIPSRIVISP